MREMPAGRAGLVLKDGKAQCGGREIETLPPHKHVQRQHSIVASASWKGHSGKCTMASARTRQHVGWEVS